MTEQEKNWLEAKFPVNRKEEFVFYPRGYEKPCFECDYENWEDIIPCLDGTEKAQECLHISRGGTWWDCTSGRKNDWWQHYEEWRHYRDGEGEQLDIARGAYLSLLKDYQKVLEEIKELKRMAWEMCKTASGTYNEKRVSVNRKKFTALREAVYSYVHSEGETNNVRT